jgi:hypothetical protein
MKALTTKDGFMTFVHADQIARAYGYASRLLLPGEQWAATTVERTYALFTSQKDASMRHLLAYSDLIKMDEQAVRTLLETVPTTAMAVSQR